MSPSRAASRSSRVSATVRWRSCAIRRSSREAATLDLLCDGRFELGIGAGWRLEDFTQLGIPFDRPDVRIRSPEEALQVIKSLLAGETVTHCGTYSTVTGLQGR